MNRLDSELDTTRTEKSQPTVGSETAAVVVPQPEPARIETPSPSEAPPRLGSEERDTETSPTRPRYFAKHKLPLEFRARYPASPFLIVNLASRSIWLLCLFSPAAWLLSFFQDEVHGKAYTNPRSTEFYFLAVLAFSILLFVLAGLGLAQSAPRLVTCACGVLGVEALQYQFWNVLLRPAIQREHRLYSAARTLLLLLMQYIQVIALYAAGYLTMFSDSFGNNRLTWRTAIEFSVLTMTTVSFGTIVPQAGSLVALLAASQALVGIFFMGMIVATTLGRTRAVEQIDK